MKFTETKIRSVFIINPEKNEDKRGYFARCYCEKEFASHGISTKIAQANTAYNRNKNTIRGLHFQIEPHAEHKLICCVKGRLWDVILDLRHDSPTFKQWMGIELSEYNPTMLFVPAGCAHGYQTLDDDTVIFYMVSDFYSPDHENGVRWNDPAFNIEWKERNNIIISDKDKNWPDFSD